MPRRNRYQMNYARLEALMGQPLARLRSAVFYRLRAPGFMDLVVELLVHSPDERAIVLSIGHYFTQNGDLCSDPEMTVRVHLPHGEELGTVEALSFEQSLPPIHQEVYPEPRKFSPRLKRELNEFLSLWLRNLEAQGHRLTEAIEHDPAN